MDLILERRGHARRRSPRFWWRLRMKGETPDELVGLRARHAREGGAGRCEASRASRCSIPAAPAATAACTFNISTVAAFVVAGAGVEVAKHGNRSLSSHCGSADILEALGVKIAVDAGRRWGVRFARSASGSCSRPRFTRR